MVGDGFCNDETNTPDCNFDGGDCCLNVKTDLCSECECHFKEFCGTGFHPWVGDGYCNDETNILECNYDGGDCCGNANTDKCYSCTCFLKETCAAGFPPFSVADGFCNDETNIPDCKFDGGDCCVNINTDHCSQCLCSGGGFITSLGFPEYITDSLDLTWLIKVPLGLKIKIYFHKFNQQYMNCE